MKEIIVSFLVSTMFFSTGVNDNVTKVRSGCCSHHGGITSSCSGSGKIICQDGTTSPSCECSSTGSNYGSSSSSSSSSNSYRSRNYSYTYGCTDSSAKNYNSSANKDDGSCVYYKYGCTNSAALNYNSEADISDGSCQFKTTITENEVINYKVKYKKSYSLRKGKSKVLKKGKKGNREISYDVITNESNNQISKTKISDRVTKKPVNKIILVDKTSKKLKKKGK